MCRRGLASNKPGSRHCWQCWQSWQCWQWLERPPRSHRRDHWFFRLRCEVFARVHEAVHLEVVLLVVQRPVAAAESEELGVGTTFHDLAVLENQDLVSAADR